MFIKICKSAFSNIAKIFRLNYKGASSIQSQCVCLPYYIRPFNFGFPNKISKAANVMLNADTFYLVVSSDPVLIAT